MTNNHDRHITLYSPIAAMSLFMNILIHPSDTRAQSDLEALVSAVGTFQSVPLGCLSTVEIGHVRELCSFIMELVMLGNSAIWKAKGEARNLVL